MALWGHQHLVPTLGIGEETGPLPGPPPLMQQDLAQVQMLPWPWLKSRQDGRATFNSTVSIRKSKRKREVRVNSDTTTESSVV